jgi:hypothetical protein
VVRAAPNSSLSVTDSSGYEDKRHHQVEGRATRGFRWLNGARNGAGDEGSSQQLEPRWGEKKKKIQGPGLTMGGQVAPGQKRRAELEGGDTFCLEQ